MTRRSACRTACRTAHAVRATVGGAALFGAMACGAPEPRVSERAAADSERAVDSSDARPTLPVDSIESPTARPILANACVRAEATSGAGWTLAQVEEGLVRLDLRALSNLAPRDSARLAARLARTVDALPSDTSVADFRGLPVVVRDAWSVVRASGDTAFVAFVERRLPMESNPLEEAFTLVAVPGTRQGVREPLLEQWFVREVGREETLDPRDFVAAFRGPDAAIFLVFVRERATGASLEIVSRTAGPWVLAWSGPVARCD